MSNVLLLGIRGVRGSTGVDDEITFNFFFGKLNLKEFKEENTELERGV